MHVGDVDYEGEQNVDEIGDASWEEVCKACCVHSPQEWGLIFVGFIGVCFFLYFFLFGLELLGSGAKVMGGCTAGELFGDETNPVAGLMIGILATVLLQSSSTTTSIVVSLVGADAVSTRQGIYMIMGANIGTSVTNTIVSMGHLGDGNQLERAFAGATVHDMFNFMTVAILFPLECASGMLYHLTEACVKNFESNEGEKWEGPIKKIVSPLGKKVIIANKKVISSVAAGGSCSDFYDEIGCTDNDNPTYETCKVGLIGCNKDNDECPAFFQPTADRHEDQISGFVVFAISIGILFFCLFGLVHILQKMLLGTSTRIIYKATNINGYLAILLGIGLTMLVQSSSITTSTLTPLVGVGALRLEQMLPLTLGANIGTTMTAIMASLVAEGTNPFQVALAHLFFNIFGILIWYPVPWMRQWPLRAARALGRTTRIWKGFPIVYILVCFFLIPLILLGVSYLFTQDSKGLTTLGSILVVLIFMGIVYTGYYCKYKGGQEKCVECMTKRQQKADTMKTLPEDMVFLKAKVNALAEHTGLPEDEEADVEANKEEAEAPKDAGTSEEASQDGEA